MATDPKWSTIHKQIFKDIDENPGNSYLYREVYEQLQEYAATCYKDEVRQLAMDLLRKFRNRPALVWQFEQMLSDEEKAEYRAWRKKMNTAQCTKCGSTKVLPIVYGLLAYDHEPKNVILGGCEVDIWKYECADCGKQYKKRPMIERPY